MKVQTYINEGPGMFWGYQPGDRLVKGPIVEVEPAPYDQRGKDADLDIAEIVWAIGNRMDTDLNGEQWPSGTRSMSVGDVIVIGEAAYKCDSVGWSLADGHAVRDSIDHGKAHEAIVAERARR